MADNDAYMIIALVSGIAIPLGIALGNVALKLHKMGLDAAHDARGVAVSAKTEIAALRTHVAENHATHGDLRETENRLIDALKRIETKVDRFNGYMKDRQP